MKESIVILKSEAFADRIFKLHKYLCETKKDFVASKQILRSGTSIGANLAEAKYASSRKDFLSKNTIALKECSETLFWLKKLKNSDILTQEQFDSMHKDCEELVKLLTRITKTLKAE
ncbi:MAG: four helix bundle protein [Alphaproteobacteria bacterium]|nr:four helix bundle protein [Alphaproteobacteria bacterium]